MKLATFRASHSDAWRIGLITDGEKSVVDLTSMAESRNGQSLPSFTSMLDLLESSDHLCDSVNELAQIDTERHDPLALSEIQLGPPLMPTSIRDCMSFERHLIGAMQTVARWRSRPVAAIDRLMRRTIHRGLLKVPSVWYERPIYYKGNPRSVVGPDDDVIWPSYSKKFDFELEFGVVIGKKGSNIAKENAAEFIAGYMLFNDFSARDTQLREMQGRLGPAKGKDFDTGNSIGPYLVTPDEISDPYGLEISVFVNDEQWCACSTKEMHFTFDELIAYISQDETLYPGDFIGAGTLPGGCGLELDRWIEPGDVVELRSRELGVLKNRIVGKA
jgi:2-keto-4-pentenoate hydratase/2-oxohepta-3-ene-1,7-dioic acid hydratase in catechol pathway